MTPEQKTIDKALCRFREIVGFLECECDSYNGFTCSIHEDRELAALAYSNWEKLTIKDAIPMAGR